LSKNNVLQELYIGNNPLKAEGALVLVRAITPQVSPESALQILDLENVWADKNILEELQTLKTLKPSVTIKLGGILSNYPVIGPNVKRILFDRANYEAMAPKRKIQQRNFGHFVLSLKTRMISRSIFENSVWISLLMFFELMKSKSYYINRIKIKKRNFTVAERFLGAVKKFKLKLSTSLITEIMHAFEGPEDTVDQALLKSSYLEEYPETTAPPEKKPKAKAKAKEKEKEKAKAKTKAKKTKKN